MARWLLALLFAAVAAGSAPAAAAAGQAAGSSPPASPKGEADGAQPQGQEKAVESTPLPRPVPRRNWAFFPGIYHAYGDHPVGGELTVLYRGVGVAVGGDGHGAESVRYAEAELGVWLLAIGVGPRWTEAGRGYQWTWALPWLPIFPYGRLIDDPGRRHSEYGLMVKVPIFDFDHLQGAL